jgi:hypothetical protein
MGAVGLPTNILIEPKNAHVDEDGTLVICPTNGNYEFAALPITYTNTGSQIVATPHPCGLASDDFCKDTSAFGVEVRLADLSTAIRGAASGSSCGTSCTICANLDPGKASIGCLGDGERYAAPVARIPVSSIPDLGPEPLAGIQLVGRRVSATALPEMTKYNQAAHDVAFSAALSSGFGNIPSVVSLAPPRFEGCR